MPRLGLGVTMRRRDFITFLGVAAAWPLAARAQQAANPVVGFLHYGSPHTFAHIAMAVRRGLQEAGYVEGQNVTIEYRWADGHYDRLPTLAAELVQRRVTVITAGGNVAAQAAKAATTVIPIVFTSGADPVWSGLVQSLSRPGANLTGASLVAAELAVKRLEVIRELLPHARIVAMIANPNYPGAESEVAEVEVAGHGIGLQIQKVIAGDVPAVETAFTIISHMRVDAVTVGTDGFFIARREQIVALAARYAVPGIYPFPDFPAAGGLASYGASLADAYRQAGFYAGRVLKGAKPADLPITQPVKFELVINLKTAKALGLTIPPAVLSRADELIE
jgi:putative ABC transport system substrate-binding protein